VVLIEPVGDNELMFGIVLIFALVLIAVLAPFFGVDSRIDEAARRRRLGY